MGHTCELAPLLNDERLAQGLGIGGMHLKPALAPAQIQIVPVVLGMRMAIQHSHQRVSVMVQHPTQRTTTEVPSH